MATMIADKTQKLSCSNRLGPLTVLEGWNGSGKTSILNAIIWALTGQILRPQRKPEETEEEFACRIAATAGADPTLHKITAVTPLPDNRFPPDLSSERIPLDTWVELTFADESGTHLPPIRRSHARTNRGAVVETPANIASLGLAPIAARIGTAIPGLLPFIQLGSISEFGEAIAQLTGLADLVDLSKHAARSKERIEKELIKKRHDDIHAHNEVFRQAKNDLQALIAETGWTAPSFAGADKRLQQHDHARSNLTGENLSSTTRWHDVPHGTMDEVRSYVRLDLSSV